MLFAPTGITFETDELIGKADYKIDASQPRAEVLAQLGAIVESSFGIAQKQSR